MFLPSVFVALVVISYFMDPNPDDAGFVVFGMLFYLPPIALLLQLIVLILYKICNYIWVNVNTAPENL